MLKCARYCHSLSGEASASCKRLISKLNRLSTVINRSGPPWLSESVRPARGNMMSVVHRLWQGEEGQDIAEYAVMLAVILVIVVGTIRLIGSNANNVFSSVASSIAQ